jgi:pyruvate carboxylase subunit B
MLRDNNIMEKYPEIIKAMSEVVRKGGFGTSVTPVSQFYFQQAFNNVLFGPWKKIAEPYGKMVLGYFGRTPVSPDPDIVKLASEQLKLEPTTTPPLELNDADPTKGRTAATQRCEAEGIETTPENIFIVAACKDKGVAFLKGQAEIGVRKNDPTADTPDAAPAASASGSYAVAIGGKTYQVSIDGDTATVNGKAVTVSAQAAGGSGTVPAAAPAAATTDVTAQMPGRVVRIVLNTGEHCTAGDPILVLEAMKMEMDVTAAVSGSIASIEVQPGDQVATGDVLATIG